MSSSTARATSGVLVATRRVTVGTPSTFTNVLTPWVHPGTGGWVNDTTSGLTSTYTDTSERRALTHFGTSADINTGVDYSYAAAGLAAASGAVRWGLPRATAAGNVVQLRTVYRPGRM